MADTSRKEILTNEEELKHSQFENFPKIFKLRIADLKWLQCTHFHGIFYS